ncbi:MAG TPA: phosphoribosylanthranilate isomerase [Chromatiaceae bacterium]|nr:phosphoribosylanthranilate isomerase [Chromatiaceae bacterium]
MKICGITRVEDGLLAAKLGADAIGLVFYPPSPRAVSADQASEIVAALPPFITVTALFVNADIDAIDQVLGSVAVDLLQFHGDEDADFCRQVGMPYIKAIRMRPDLDVCQSADDYADARGLLLDSYQAGVPGGTGARFDWDRIPENLDFPLILAGGLNADNVAQAIDIVSPWAVDVSGGVETSKGIKSSQKLGAFFRSVARADPG